MNKSLIGVCLSSAALGMSIGSVLINCELANRREDLQEKVKEFGVSSKEYNAINDRANSNRISNILTWQQALDSLKTEAACKKAYLEGAQMVRDSIANAQKAE